MVHRNTVVRFQKRNLADFPTWNRDRSSLQESMHSRYYGSRWNPEAWYLHKIYWHASVVTLASPSSRPHPRKNCPNFLVDKDSGAQKSASPIRGRKLCPHRSLSSLEIWSTHNRIHSKLQRVNRYRRWILTDWLLRYSHRTTPETPWRV